MKTIVTFCFLVCLSISGFSQEKEPLKERKTSFGIIQGFKQDFFTPSPSDFNELSIYGGLFVESKLSKRFGLQFELLHTKTQSAGRYRFEIPVLLKYRLDKNLSLYMGPQLNLNYRDANISDLRSKKPSIFAFNIGIQYDISKRWFYFARYTYNFKEQTISNQTDRVKSFQVGIGYRF